MTVKLNGVDISEMFDVRCKKCGSENITITGYSSMGYGHGAVDCNDCQVGVDECE